jgi:hypothetical protein
MTAILGLDLGHCKGPQIIGGKCVEIPAPDREEPGWAVLFPSAAIKMRLEKSYHKGDE